MRRWFTTMPHTFYTLRLPLTYTRAFFIHTTRLSPLLLPQHNDDAFAVVASRVRASLHTFRAAAATRSILHLLTFAPTNSYWFSPYAPAAFACLHIHHQRFAPTAGIDVSVLVDARRLHPLSHAIATAVYTFSFNACWLLVRYILSSASR